MKTTIYFSALLALIIQVMVKDQTPVAQVISHNTSKLSGNKPHNNLNDPDLKKFTPVLHYAAQVRPPHITKSGSLAEKKQAVINRLVINDQQSASNNSSSYSKQMFTLSELQQQASDLNAKSIKLRSAAKNSDGLVKTELNYEANELYKLYVLKQIEVSEQWAQMAYAKYAQNKENIKALFNNYRSNQNTSGIVQTLSGEADHLIKMAKEMREEAYAMPTLQAKYGTMTNAEEKEMLALSNQDKALELIKPRVINLNKQFEFAAYYPKTETLDDLLQDAYDLNAKSQKLNGAAKTSKGLTKTELSMEAGYLYRLYELKEIAASELSAKMTYEKFAQNKTIFNELVNNYRGDKSTSGNAKNLIADAEKYLKMAKEIREEANAMPSIEAKWGTMSNAEEKETLALNKEDKAIDLIKKTAPNYSFKVSGESMANLIINTK